MFSDRTQSRVIALELMVRWLLAERGMKEDDPVAYLTHLKQAMIEGNRHWHAPDAYARKVLDDALAYIGVAFDQATEQARARLTATPGEG